MNLSKNLENIRLQIEKAAREVKRDPAEITLIAVSKGRTVDEIKQHYRLGIRDFGENRLFEALSKKDRLPSDIRWHFIGKLQRNKVSQAVGQFALIHSVDSYELALKLERISSDRGICTRILLQANTSGEATKGGYSPKEWKDLYQKLLSLHSLKIQGFMTMAPYTQDEALIRECFRELKKLLQHFRLLGGSLSILSMGMTNDFPLAIQEGATHLRIGTALFA